MRDKRIVGSQVLHLVSMAVLLFCFWLLLSGTLQMKFLIYGILTAIVAAWVTYPLLLVPNADGSRLYFVFGVNPVKLIWYFLWLLWQLILANMDVIKSTVRPEIRINPRVVRFRFRADNPMAAVALANSITLTPGTVTMNVEENGLFEVHALTDGAAEGVMDGAGMPKQAAWLFGVPYEFELLEEAD